jgi:hypothetical protein
MQALPRSWIPDRRCAASGMTACPTTLPASRFDSVTVGDAGGNTKRIPAERSPAI